MNDIIGLTNALTDIIVKVTPEELNKIGLKKGFWNLKREINREAFEELVKNKDKKLCQAGSPGNVIFNLAKLGFKTGLIGTLSNDEIGEKYISKLLEYEIEPYIEISTGESGACYILISDDGERTSVANIGVGAEFGFNVGSIEKYKLFHTSGYELVTNPRRTWEIISHMKDKGTKISFDLADPKVIRNLRKGIEKVIEKTDILFMTEEEAKELRGNPQRALDEEGERRITILKKGKRGSSVKWKKERYDFGIYPTRIVNTCGAGDAFASGFISKYLENCRLDTCIQYGSEIASIICAREESHL